MVIVSVDHSVTVLVVLVVVDMVVVVVSDVVVVLMTGRVVGAGETLCKE